MTNPYAKYLGSEGPLAVIAATPGKVETLLWKIGPKGSLEPSAPGKWSARDILSHLADCEVVFAFRIRQALAKPHHVIQPFDQDDWAMQYAGYDARTAATVFAAVRQWNLALLQAVTPEALGTPLTHPERGEMTLQTVVETMAGHDLNHLGQLEVIAARQPRMS